MALDPKSKVILQLVWQLVDKVSYTRIVKLRFLLGGKVKVLDKHLMWLELDHG